MLIALLTVLAIGGLICTARLLQAVVKQKAWPTLEAVTAGAVTNFFDTLGIGSFAPTMAWLKLRNLVPDRLIPCTMLVGHTLPTLTQALIFLILLGVLVDPVLLIGCGVALLAGALIGASLVMKTRVWIVQTIVGVGAHRRRAYLRADQPAADARRRDGGRAVAYTDLRCDRRKLRDRRAAELRHWQLCADFGDVQLDGHGPTARFSDHGGRRGARGMRRERAPHRHRRNRPSHRNQPHARRHSGGPTGCLCRQEHAGRDAALACRRGRALHSAGHVPRCVAGTEGRAHRGRTCGRITRGSCNSVLSRQDRCHRLG